MTAIKPRFIAFYLPQYHPIPENDVWWGKGFTEWTNVAKAKPLFKDHYQPHIPADLGFYDLRVPETQQAQADLAREYGIEGFCYWHYWFAGKSLLERPFNQVLQSGKPNFPFCLAWANQSWTGIWHGTPNQILIEQTYPGKEDHIAHFYSVLPALLDKRYLLVDGKPIFIIYKPAELEFSEIFIDLWQNLAIKHGLKGIYFLGISNPNWDYNSHGYNGVILTTLESILGTLDHKRQHELLYYSRKKIKNLFLRLLHYSNHPLIYSYNNVVDIGLPPIDPQKGEYPSIFPNWDNTPRSNARGIVLHKSTPELFKIQVSNAISQVSIRPHDKQLVFIKSWNEWAEGNHLEPDLKFGRAYLEAIKDSLSSALTNHYPH
jgi:lipopolysaccharide biosynthesis protein